MAATSEVYAQPGDPNYSGCFVCGSREHSWRECPKRSSSSKGKGKGTGRTFWAESVFMVCDESDSWEIEGPKKIPESSNEPVEEPSDLSNIPVNWPADSPGALLDLKLPSYLEEGLSVKFKASNDQCRGMRVGCSNLSSSSGAVLDLRNPCALPCCAQDCCLEQRSHAHVMVVTSSDPEADESPLMAAVADEVDMRAFAVIDSGATETVGSLPAIDDLLAVRYETYGRAEEFRVSDAPPRRFRFGNGALGFSVSHLLLPQDLGQSRIDLGIFALDVERVPILIGVRTLRSLSTVIDFQHDVAVFSALDPTVGVPLRRSRSGHLLLNLGQNWLEESFPLTSPARQSFHPAEPAETREHGLDESANAVFVAISEATCESPASPTACTNHPATTERAIEEKDEKEATTKPKAKSGKKKNNPAPELDWDRVQPMGPRDVRALGPPCQGQHDEKESANQHALWRFCRKCGIRTIYVPRFGKTGMHRSAGPILKDTEKVIEEAAKTESLEFNPRLRDLQAAETSALKQLAKIRERKDKILPPKSTAQSEGPMENPSSKGSPVTSSPGQSSVESAILVGENEDQPPKLAVVDVEQISRTPGNKRHQGLTPEEQEYNQRSQKGS
eukprot:s2874_g9.t1